MSLGGFVLCATVLGFPRVSGDEPGGSTATSVKAMFSPRERG